MTRPTNGGDLSGGPIVAVNLEADMEAFNNLSPALRAALNYASDEYSAIEAATLLSRIPEQRLIEILCPSPKEPSTE